MPTITLRRDPTRTTTLRKAWERDSNRRFKALSKAVKSLVVGDDAFGLDEAVPFTINVENQVWRFLTDAGKVEEFRNWLQDQIDIGVLTVDHLNKPWLVKYTDAAHRKGKIRAFNDSRRVGAGNSSSFKAGQQVEFLRSAFSESETLGKLALLATRAFESLRGISAQMAANMSVILTNGLSQGLDNVTIAKNLTDRIGIVRKRALTIVRTEIVHAHAEGQLDSFAALNIPRVGAYSEWSTAGDDKVCPMCDALEGTIFTIKEARGLIPRHPNCRCAWLPAVDVKTKNRRRSLFRRIRKSLKAEGGNKKSVWSGKTIKKTPRSNG